MVKVALTANLQKYYPEAKFEISASTLRELLRKMDEKQPFFSRYILEDDGAIRKHVNVFINGNIHSDKRNIDVKLAPGTQVHIMQALSGG